MTTAEGLPAVPSKSDLVYELLRDEILQGEFQPGDRLSMDAIARRLGVSKIPVREAMQRLQSKGLVTQNAHSGPVVSELDPDELEGIYLTRQAIDGLAAELAAKLASEDQLESLDRLQASIRHSRKRADVDRMWMLDQAFHAELAAIAGFQILSDITELLMLAVRRHRVVEPLPEAGWADVIAEHDSILEALQARDSQAASAAARWHAVAQVQRPEGKHASWHGLRNVADNIAAGQA